MAWHIARARPACYKMWLLCSVRTVMEICGRDGRCLLRSAEDYGRGPKRGTQPRQIPQAGTFRSLASALLPFFSLSPSYTHPAKVEHTHRQAAAVDPSPHSPPSAFELDASEVLVEMKTHPKGHGKTLPYGMECLHACIGRRSYNWYKYSVSARLRRWPLT